jgi:hypothetical protein
MNNKDLIGKYVILKDIFSSDYYKDENGQIKLFDTYELALQTAWIAELTDVIIVHVVDRYDDDENLTKSSLF